MGRPRCLSERSIPGYSCHHRHCLQCGGHFVWVSKYRAVPACELEGQCIPPLEAFGC